MLRLQMRSYVTSTHRKDALEERYDFIMKQSERVNCFFYEISSLTLQQLEDRRMMSSELLGANLKTQSLSDRFEANKCRRAPEHLKAEVSGYREREWLQLKTQLQDVKAQLDLKESIGLLYDENIEKLSVTVSIHFRMN